MRRRDPFVGRDPELGALRDALDGSLAGEGRMLWLEGEPGIGKTRLASALAAEAEGRGAAVAWGRCSESEGVPAYWPLIQAFSALVEASPGEQTDRLAAILPALRAGEESANSGVAPDRARFELIQRVSAALVACARARPLLLVLDDLQWADAGSLHLIDGLASELPGAPLLLVGTLRNDAASPEAELPSWQRRGRALPLAGLQPAAVRELLAAQLGGPRADGMLDRVSEMTAGNPFFVIEVAHWISVEGGDDGGAPLVMPPGVRELLRTRLGALPEGSLRLLEVAAVVGPEFDLDPLVRVLAEPAPGLLSWLDPALAAGLVRPVPGRLRRYAFSHALLRESLYLGLGRGERAALHGAVGEAIESLCGRAEDRLPALAHHFYEAAQVGDPQKALRYGVEAGERALRLLAFEEARTHFERALEAASFAPDERLRLRALMGLGSALHGAGDRTRAEGTLRDAVARARELEGEAFAEAVLRLTEVRAELALMDVELNALLEEALAALPSEPSALPSEPSALRARVMARLAAGLNLQPGGEERRRRLSDEATAAARELGDAPTLGFVLACRLVGLSGPDTLDERLATADEILRAGTSTPSAELEALISRVDDLAERGDRVGLDHALSVFERKASASRQPFFLWHATTFRAAMALLEGRFEAAEGLMVEALSEGQRVVAKSAQLQFAQQLFVLRGWQARFVEVEPLLEQGVAETAVVPAWRCALAYYYQLAGREAESRREYEALAVRSFEDIPRDTTWLTGMVLSSILCSRFDDTPRAEVLYAKLRPYAGRIAVASPLVTLVGNIDLRLGVLASRLGRAEVAERHFEEAMAIAEHMRALCWQADVRYEQAMHLARRGGQADRQRGLELLDRAEAIASAVGMKLMQGWIAEGRAELERPGLGVAVSVTARAAGDRRRIAGPTLSLVPRRSASPSGAQALASTPKATPDRPVPGPPQRSGSFRREGELWTVFFDGRTSRFRPMVGLGHLSRLLQQPGREIHSLDLVAGANGHAPEATPMDASGDAGELLDAQARQAYQARLREARQELEDAQALGDLGRAERVRDEIEMVAAQLSGAFGLGGRPRRAGSAPERARLSVTRAIKYAIDKIDGHDPDLADHLRRNVRTGSFCAYTPSPRDPVAWTL